MNLTELRQKYPEYKDMSDEEFVSGFHKKFYSDIPEADFHKKIGFSKGVPQTPGDYFDRAPGAVKGLVGAPEAALSMVAGLPSQIIGGLSGLGKLMVGRGIDEAGQTVRNVQEANFGAGSFKGYTKPGKYATEKIGEAFAMPGEYAGDVGAFVGKQLGNEELGRFSAKLPVDVAMNFLPLHLGVVKPVKAISDLAGKMGDKKLSMEERLAAAREQQAATQAAAAPPQLPEAPVAPDLRLELPAMADKRVAEQNRNAVRSADDWNSMEHAARAVDEEILASEEARKAAEAEALAAEQLRTHEFLRDAQQTVIDDTPYGDPGAQFGYTPEFGRVDENGIPIRADLSIEAQNLQNPLQRNLWGDELPTRSQDNSIGMTQALDKMPPGPERDLALSQLRGQRGAIDLQGVLDSLSRLKAGIIHPREYVNSFVGAFNPELTHDMGWKYAIEESLDPKSRSRMVLMSPDTFHKLALPRDPEYKTSTHSGARRNNIEEALTYKEEGLDSVPMLKIDSGKIYGHEGRHRMDVFKEMGVEQVPVIIRDSMIRNESGPLPYKFLISEGTDSGMPRHHVPMDRITDVFNTPNQPLNTGMSRGQRGAIDFGGSFKQKQDIIQEVVGKKLYANKVRAEDIRTAALAEGKDGKGATNLSSGGTMEANKRDSALIQGGVRMMQREKNIAEDLIRTTVFPVETAFRQLGSKKNIKDLVTVLKDEMFNRAALTMEQLANVGLSEKQLVAYNKLRDMQKAALEDQNSVRRLQGLPEITEAEAYMASRWQGDFRRAIHNKEGKLVWYLAADNKLSLDHQTKQMMEKFPEDYGGHTDSVVKSTKGGTDAKQLYSTVLDILGRDDPAVAKIAAWMEQQVVETGRGVLGQEKHFEPKANVRGFVGDRPWKNPNAEALAYIQQQINYAKNAHKWSAVQRASLEMKKLFSDPDLSAQQPNNMKYLREYWMDNLGFNENKGIQGLEDTIRSAGISPNQLGRGITNLKSLWITQKLAVNLGFYVANAIQAGNVVPSLANLRAKHGGNPILAAVEGMPYGMLMASGHSLKNPQLFYKTLAVLPGDVKFMAEAMKYAEDNSVIARSIYDESPVESSFGVTGVASKIARATTSLPETYLRAISYMTYVHMLKSSGKFKNNADIFRLAEEQVNLSMGDYREGERAMMFNKLGNVGNAMNVLQTFPMNYYNQWSWAIREAARGNPATALTMLAVQGYMAGAMGVPGFAEIDKLIELGKDALAENAPLVWNKVKNFSLKRGVLDVAGPAALYGGLSEHTGVGLTARAAAPIPSEMVQTPGAPAVDLVKQGASVVNAAAQGFTDPQKNAQALYNITPSGLQGALETGPLQDQTSVQRPDGTRVYGQSTKLAERKGMYARTPEEEKLRSLGFRSQKEVVTREQNYQAQKQIVQAESIVRSAPKTIYNKLRNNDMESAKDYIRLYVQLSGNNFSPERLKKEAIEEFTTPDERMKMKKNLPIESMLVLKRLDQSLKEMGYAN